MENVLSIIRVLMPFFHGLAAFGLILKIILMLGFRNFDLPYFVLSYFRFYGRSDFQMAENKQRRLYVRLNNLVNYYTYVWAFLCLICLLAFGSLY
ncbi:MAG: hypothetical protein ABJA79_03170 [Parafilimonas sp.]